MLEIEQKFRIDDLSKTAAQIHELFTVISDTVEEQVDWYYAHPTRDFGATDEALRIRRTVVQGKNGAARSTLTYKGPRIDPSGESREFKSRREIEILMGEISADGNQIGELLEALGFVPTATITKVRRCLTANLDQWKVEFALDDVLDLGTFIEIEIVVSEDSAPDARTTISNITKQLALHSPITDSYRNMLFGK